MCVGVIARVPQRLNKINVFCLFEATSNDNKNKKKLRQPEHQTAVFSDLQHCVATAMHNSPKNGFVMYVCLCIIL